MELQPSNMTPRHVTYLYGTFPLFFLGVFLGNINSLLFPVSSKKMHGIFKLDKVRPRGVITDKSDHPMRRRLLAYVDTPLQYSPFSESGDKRMNEIFVMLSVGTVAVNCWCCVK
ncbi:hypothetical protein TNCV_905671 [Trichonephila clavipes]|nr:hypothetical protein TNCV_905671 [Trichonephila clavipes]